MNEKGSKLPLLLSLVGQGNKGPSLLLKDYYAYYYKQLLQEQVMESREEDFEPVEGLPEIENLPEELEATGEEALSQTVMIRLNGGVATSMGSSQARSLLKVQEGLRVLDILALQARQAGVPLLLMNTASTRAESLKIMGKYTTSPRLPFDFLQHRFPTLRGDTLGPLSWPDQPALEWHTPGYGDLYLSLVTSGLLDRLLQKGYRYAFVSEAENLGATLDKKLLGYFARLELPFLMEVIQQDKGEATEGYLAQRPDGQLLVRDPSQVWPEKRGRLSPDGQSFYANTNNIWLHLPSLKRLLQKRSFLLPLPLRCLLQNADPADPSSPEVLQMETQLGDAISLFPHGQAIRVRPSRFLPIKSTSDLLKFRSDRYVLDLEYRLRPRHTSEDLTVRLDPLYYQTIDEMESRFTEGLPSLARSQRFEIKGDISFGSSVVCQGAISLNNPYPDEMYVPPRTLLDGSLSPYLLVQ